MMSNPDYDRIAEECMDNGGAIREPSPYSSSRSNMLLLPGRALGIFSICGWKKDAAPELFERGKSHANSAQI